MLVRSRLAVEVERAAPAAKEEQVPAAKFGPAGRPAVAVLEPSAGLGGTFGDFDQELPLDALCFYIGAVLELL